MFSLSLSFFGAAVVGTGADTVGDNGTIGSIGGEDGTSTVGAGAGDVDDNVLSAAAFIGSVDDGSSSCSKS